MRIPTLIAITFLAAGAAQPGLAAAREGWKTYAVPDLGFSIQVPPDFIYRAPNPSAPNLSDRVARLSYPEEMGSVFILLTSVDNPRKLALNQWLKSLRKDYGYVPEYRNLLIGARRNIKAIRIDGVFEGQIEDEVVFRDAGADNLIRLTLIIRGVDDWMEVPYAKLRARYSEQTSLYDDILATIRLAR